MKIIIVAYDCNPLKGSESGLGWNWVKSAIDNKKIEKIYLITTQIHKEDIEKYLESNLDILKKVSFYYITRPIEKIKINQRIKYILWQRKIISIINKICKKNEIEFVHHVTWATCVLPSALYKVKNTKIVFGPVGGGERIHKKIDIKLKRRDYIVEKLRKLLADLSKISILNRLLYKSSSLILTTTEETKNLIPYKYRDKTFIMQSIGAEDSRIKQINNTSRFSKTFNIIMVGRMLCWKGIDIGIRAVQELVKEGFDIKLTIIGSGKNKINIDEGNSHWLSWINKVNYLEMDNYYDNSDILLNCSLHDSGCMVILESMSRGLPIICINSGGPKVLVDDKCAIRIEPATMERMNTNIKNNIKMLINSPEKCQEMSKAGIDRINQEFLYSKKYDQIFNLLDKGNL